MTPINEVNDVATIEGSFVAPESDGAGPDFYVSEVNDCKHETYSTTFLTSFIVRTIHFQPLNHQSFIQRY